MYISGNGEYYATVMQYGGWYEFEYKDKNGKSLWKITPKDNYGFFKAYISYDGSRVVIIDMGGLGGGDEWEVLGQRVYFYDNAGRLLKDYDYGENVDNWLSPEHIAISKNSQYFAALMGFQTHVPIHDEHSVVLYGADGQILYSKKLSERHVIGGISSDGKMLVDGYSAGKKTKIYLLDKKGSIILAEDVKGSFGLSQSGRYLFKGSSISIGQTKSGRARERNLLSVIEIESNKLLYSVDTSEIFMEPEIDMTFVVDILENDIFYVSFAGYSFEKKPVTSYIGIIFSPKTKKILWRTNTSIKFMNDGRLIKAGHRLYSIRGGK